MKNLTPALMIVFLLCPFSFSGTPQKLKRQVECELTYSSKIDPTKYGAGHNIRWIQSRFLLNDAQSSADLKPVMRWTHQTVKEFDDGIIKAIPREPTEHIEILYSRYSFGKHSKDPSSDIQRFSLRLEIKIPESDYQLKGVEETSAVEFKIEDRQTTEGNFYLFQSQDIYLGNQRNKHSFRLECKKPESDNGAEATEE